MEENYVTVTRCILLADQACSPKKRSGGRVKQDLDKDF